MKRRTVRVGTRGSALAIAQTEEVVSALGRAWPEADFEVVRITPDGDRRKSAPLLSLGRGAFAKGVEEWLLDGRIDMAVHSAKDMPATLPEGLVIAAYPERKDARDVIVSRLKGGFFELRPGARLGTSSPRRSGQLLAARSDIEIVPIRGNVDTRLSKVCSDGLDGVVLAAAGLERLGRIGEATEILDPELCAPDAGQGALAVETREGDERMREMVGAINHAPTWAAVSAERAFVDFIGGGCRVPVAAYAVPSGGKLRITTMACLPDGSRIYRKRVEASAVDPVSAGREAARSLMETGADTIVYGERGP